jgi:glutaconate CoA-transferase, subunit A
VEEIVADLDPRPGAVVLPTWAVTCVSETPGGAAPSYAQDYYERDNDAYRAWDAVSRDRERFTAWLDAHRSAAGRVP